MAKASASGGAIRSLFVALRFKVDHKSMNAATRAVERLKRDVADAATGSTTKRRASFKTKARHIDLLGDSAADAGAKLSGFGLDAWTAAEHLDDFVDKTREATRELNKLNAAQDRSTRRGRAGAQAVGAQAAQTTAATRASRGLVASLGGIAAAYISLEAVMGAGRALANHESQIARLQVLEGGSLGGANEEYERLLAFSKRYSLNLNEVIDSYAQMTNFGMDASNDALLSMANVAASNPAKNVSMWTDAVADASALSFERLQEFNIRAISEGDKVAFTFQNQTTMIDRNASAIQEHLTSLGHTAFAGNVEAQANTIGGAFRSLKTQMSESLADIFYSGEGADRRESPIVTNIQKMVRGIGGLIKVIVPLVKVAMTALMPAFILVGGVMELINEHTVFFSTLLGSSGLMFLISKLVGAMPLLIGALTTLWTRVVALAASWTWMNAMMLLIPLAIALIVDDLHAFATGGESLIGGLINKLTEMGGGWALIGNGIKGVANFAISAVTAIHELLTTQDLLLETWLEMPWNKDEAEAYHAAQRRNAPTASAAIQATALIDGGATESEAATTMYDRALAAGNATRSGENGKSIYSKSQTASLRRAQNANMARALMIDGDTVRALQMHQANTGGGGAANLTVRVDASGAMDAAGIQQAAEEGARVAIAESDRELTRDYVGGEAQ